MPELTYSKVNRDILRTLETPGKTYFVVLALVLCALGFGIYCWVHQIYTGLGMAGYSVPAFWAVYITNFVFWVGIGHAGTLISAILYLFRAKFRTPVYRSSEAMTIFAVMTAGLFPLIHLGRVWYFYWLMPYPNQRQLWPNFRSPLIWDVFAVGTYFTVSSMFFILGLIPDIAVIRDQATGIRKRIYTLLSLGWQGTARQWRHFNSAYLFFAAFATPLVVSVHSVVSWDFAMALVPGWHSTIFAPYFVAGAIHSGIAMVITLLIPMRKLLKLDEFLEQWHFESLAKILILTGLIVSYAYGIEFFMAWYGGSVFEWGTFVDRATGAFAPFFWMMVAFNCFAPMLFLFKKLRTSTFWLMLISLLINVGMWLERYVIIAGSLSHAFDPAMWKGLYHPTWTEAGITLGSFAWFFTLFLIFIKLFPAVSMTEVKEALPAPTLGRAPRAEEASL
jgi:Ni/Fe-hydrogenase subunit HybB-like protein